MPNYRPRRRGRPSKTDSQSRSFSSKPAKIEFEDDDESNQSSSTNNTSISSKYVTRSRKSTTRKNSTPKTHNNFSTKKRGRKRKKDYDSEDDADEDDFDDESIQPTVLNMSDKDDDDDDEADDDEEFKDLEEETDDENDDDEDENESRRRLRRSREKTPMFLDDDGLPELTLPDSSDDLLINGNQLIRCLSVYEILRHFSSSIRLTPFRFEDFCVALLIDEQTYLLSEIHIQLLKSLIREDDLIGTQHGPQDVRDSIAIYLYLCDHLTWPEVLRIYLSSDLKRNSKIIQNCLDESYPFTDLEKKLTLMEYLCDEFLNTQNARDMINNEGKLEHDEHCRVCQRNGEMLMCDNCTAVFHLGCLDPPLKQVPDTDWFCPVCKQNQVNGVTDCANEYENQLTRQEPIGWDRHGRKYWFLARRIVVEDGKSTNKCWYYSTRLQFDELLSSLDRDCYEKDLYQSLTEFQEDIYRQMAITEKLTKLAKGTRKSYLEVVNEELFCKQSAKIKSESDEKYADLESKLSVDDDDLRGGGVQTRLKTGSLQQKPISLDPFKNQVNIYNSINTFREEDTVIVVNENSNTLSRQPRKSLSSSYLQNTLFKLGLEGNYRNFQNIYSINIHALSKLQAQDDRDRKRHLSNKFSLTPASEIKWAYSYNQGFSSSSSTIYGPKSTLISVLRQTLLHIESNLSQSFMHPNWKLHREKWHKAITMCKEPQEFGLALYILESSMKPVLFVNFWRESLGFTVLQRTTQLEREEQKKKERKGRDPVEPPLNLDLDSSKLSFCSGLKLIHGKLRHQIWKQKGEEFRYSGVGGWFWIHHMRNLFTSNQIKLEKDLSTENSEAKTNKNLNDEESATISQTEKNNLIDDHETLINISGALNSNDSEILRRKYYSKIFSESKLDKILSLRTELIKLESTNKKNDKQKTHDVPSEPSRPCCYSSTCDLEDVNSKLKCYSPLCRFEHKKMISMPLDLTETIELRKIVRVDGVEQLSSKTFLFNSKGQLPPSSRFWNGKNRTIFLPLNHELHHLGRTGGLIELNGFNYCAKMNSSVWPYGTTPRPFFRTTWLYRTHNLSTIHCAAMQLRILWASIRWDDLATKPPASGTNTITTENDVQTIEIIKRRDLPPFGLRSEYLIRTIIVPMELPTKSREISTPNRSGLRERKRPESPKEKGPRMTEKWVREEEIELWEIRQFSEKQVILAKQRALQDQKQLELKKKLSVDNKNEVNKIQSGNININPNKPTYTRLSGLIQNRNKIITGSNTITTTSTAAAVNTFTIPYATTIQTSQGHAIKLQTVSNKPQYLIRTAGTHFVASTNLNSPVISSGNRTFIVRTPIVTTTDASQQKPIQIQYNPTSLNGPILRPINTVNSNVRQSIPFIATNCPKKISTLTTVNAILTTNTWKTVSASSTINTVTSTSNTVTPSVVSLNTPSAKNIQCLPVKTSDGRMHFFPINSLATTDGINITFNNNQIRFVTRPADPSSNSVNQTSNTAPVAGSSIKQSILVNTNSTMLAPMNTFILSQNSKVVLSNNQLKPTIITQPVQAGTPAASKTIILKNCTVATSNNHSQTDSMSFKDQFEKASDVTVDNVSKETVRKSDEASDFVVTPEMTQEVVRKALMNPNVAPEIAQKLIALQRHHKEQADSSKPFHQLAVTNLNNSNCRTGNSLSGRSELSSRSSTKTSRYSRSRDDDDDDYVYQYPHYERSTSRTSRQTGEDDSQRICRNIIKNLIDKIEKEEKREKQRESMKERRIKKAIQMKLKYRQNHIEIIRRLILRRKSKFNQEIKSHVEKTIDAKLQKALPSLTSNYSAQNEIMKNEVDESKANIETDVQDSMSSEIKIPKNRDLNHNEISTISHHNSFDHNKNNSHDLKAKKRSFSSTTSSSAVSNSLESDENEIARNHQKRFKNSDRNLCHNQKSETPNAKKRYCVCNNRNDKSTMICCDQCKNWFHIRCVNIEQKEAKKLPSFLCPDCSKSDTPVNSQNKVNSQSKKLINNSGNLKNIINNKRPGRGRPPKHTNRSVSSHKNKNDSQSLPTSMMINTSSSTDDGEEDQSYCICNEKYDSNEFYIFCDFCNEWFHGRCVGVTCLRAEKIAKYRCPVCEGPNSPGHKYIQPLNEENYGNIAKILKSLQVFELIIK